MTDLEDIGGKPDPCCCGTFDRDSGEWEHAPGCPVAIEARKQSPEWQAIKAKADAHILAKSNTPADIFGKRDPVTAATGATLSLAAVEFVERVAKLLLPSEYPADWSHDCRADAAKDRLERTIEAARELTGIRPS